MGARWWSVIPTHVHYFTRRSLCTLLARHGWRVVEITTAPKAFTVGYYLGRVEGYSPPVARALVSGAQRRPDRRTDLGARLPRPDGAYSLEHRRASRRRAGRSPRRQPRRAPRRRPGRSPAGPSKAPPSGPGARSAVPARPARTRPPAACAPGRPRSAATTGTRPCRRTRPARRPREPVKRLVGVQTIALPRQTRCSRSSALTGSLRCSSRSPQKIRSNAPRSVSRSYTDRCTRLTCEPRAAQARAKRAALVSSSVGSTCPRQRGGQSRSSTAPTSVATTSAAPRRSISKAQKPSIVPTSRHRRPDRCRKEVAIDGRTTIEHALRDHAVARARACGTSGSADLGGEPCWSAVISSSGA